MAFQVKKLLLFVILMLSFLSFSGCSAVTATVSTVGRNIGALFTRPDTIENRITDPIRPGARLAVLWVGHATVLIQIDDKVILTDPNLTPTVGQFSKRLIEPGIDPEHLPELDLVLVSHMHIDHLSLGSLDMIESRTRQLLVPAGGLVYIPNFDFPTDELAEWEVWEADGLRITAVPVLHNGWRYVLDDAWMKTSYTGYIISYRGISVFFAGDTGYNDNDELFKEIGRRYGPIELVFLPIAPIHPRDYSRKRHTDPADAIKIYRDVDARMMIPMHYGTFPESLDKEGEARQTMVDEMRRNHLTPDQVRILDVGEQVVIIPGSTVQKL